MRLSIAIALLAVFGLPSAALAQEHLYVGVKKCRTCHKKELIGEQYQSWKDSPHAKAYESLKSAEALEIAKAKGLAKPPHQTDECLKCHATAHGLEASQMKYKLSLEDGVQCESCHGPGNDYRKKKIMSDHDKSVAKGMLEPSDKRCRECHNDESPTWEKASFELANGTTVHFDFDLAKEKIAHPIPKDVKGKYIELEKAQKKKKGGASDDEDD